MYNKGHIANVVDFDTSWSEHMVRHRIKSRYPMIDKSKPYTTIGLLTV